MMKKLLLGTALCLVSSNGVFAGPGSPDTDVMESTQSAPYTESECFVCFEELQNNQAIDLCENGHEYHAACSTGPCPMCRATNVKHNIFGAAAAPEEESLPRTQESSDPTYDAEKWDAPKKERPSGRRAPSMRQPSSRQPRSSSTARSRSERPTRSTPSRSPRVRSEDTQQGSNKQVTLERRLTNAQRSLDRLNDKLVRTKAGSAQEASVLRSIDQQKKNIERLKQQLGK